MKRGEMDIMWLVETSGFLRVFIALGQKDRG